MCGIIGYVGDKNFIEVSKECLKKLEYRGYDSAGIAYFEKYNKNNNKDSSTEQNNRIVVKKEVGNVEHLFETIKDKPNTTCGIGHTRWATNGKPSKINAHPHKSQDDEFYVVHNGVIECYEQIKEKYLKNVIFESNTDTEIIPNIISYFYKQTNDTIKSIQKTMKILKGSFSFCVIHCSEPNKIFFAKYKSPLLIGIGKNGEYISSDLQGLDNQIEEYIPLEDNNLGYITKDEILVLDKNFRKINTKPQKNRKKMIKNDIFIENKYKHYMLKEIHEIPNAILDTIKIYSKTKNPLEKIPKKYFDNIENIIFIACGTSYHSALVGEKYIKEFTKYNAKSYVASEFLYSNEKIDEKSVCIFISQSGETADTLSAIKKVKTMMIKTIGITNVLNSNICSLCDYILPLNAGAEVAVASTKAYICQLVVLLIFSVFLSKNNKKMQFLMKKLNIFAKKLNIEQINNTISPLINRIIKSNNIYCIGRDYDYITSLEASLKIKEITYIPCFAIPAGELKHGTLALITMNTPVLVIITEKKLIEKTMMIAEQVKARGGDVYIFSQFDLSQYNINQYKYIKLENFDELLMPIYTIIPFQLLSYNMAVSLAYNPDKPRNLAKSVTVE